MTSGLLDCGWVISFRCVEKKYRLNLYCYEWIQGLITLKIQAARSFETSRSNYPTTRPKSHKTCFQSTKTDLQLWNPSALCYFLWGTAASFPHYLNRVFRCGLSSSVSLVIEPTRCLCYWLHPLEEIHTRFKRRSMAGSRPQPCSWADALHCTNRTEHEVRNIFPSYFCLV
jgi:hypothetical protein